MKRQGLLPAMIYASAILTGVLWSAGPAWADTPPSGETPSQPVGQAPQGQNRPPQVETLISTAGVLPPAGQFVIEPFLQYAHSSSSIAAVQGFVVAQVLAVGIVNIQQYSSDTAIAGLTLRYGITNRVEADIRVPFVWNQQNLNVTNLTSTGLQQGFNSSGSGLGDIEAALHWQVNQGGDGWPYFVANLRAKSMTGSSPFSMPPNGAAIAAGIPGILAQQPTGTGFWAVEPSLTAIYPTDPAVLYGNVGYIWNIGHDVGGRYISPGNAVDVGFGMGISLNDRTSVSLGYDQEVVNPPTVNGVQLPLTQTLEVGSFLVGWSYQVNKRTNVDLNLAVGATPDAPNVQLTLRVPYDI